MKYATDWITSWPAWMALISVGVTLGLPRVPYYQEGLPYIYALGGMALVVWFIGLGFLMLGLYSLVMGCVGVGWFLSKRLQAVLLGGVALILAGGCHWFYLLLLEMSIRVT